jgi:hypothetical protein
MVLFQRFLDLCLLKAGPADMPSSIWLLKALVVLFAIIEFFSLQIVYPWWDSMMTSLMRVCVLMVFVYGILYLNSRRTRFIQTVIAVLGAGIILNIVSIPITLAAQAVHEMHNQLTSIILLLVMVLMFWVLMVHAHIFQQALDVKSGRAAVAAVVYVLLNMLISRFLLGEV